MVDVSGGSSDWLVWFLNGLLSVSLSSEPGLSLVVLSSLDHVRSLVCINELMS